VPYKSVQVLLTTWTRCTVCKVPVEHLEQPGHDEWHAWLAQCRCRDEAEPVLEEAS
jgi:hypothetical protein